MNMHSETNALDAALEIQSWFAATRLRLSNKVEVEVRLPRNSSENAAMVGLATENIVCSLSLTGGESIDPTILAYTKAKIRFGAIEYLVDDFKSKKNVRCKDIIVGSLTEMRTALNECFDDFLKITADLP